MLYCLYVSMFVLEDEQFFVCSMYAGVINDIICLRNHLKSQVQEDFHCNEDALFIVFSDSPLGFVYLVLCH